MRITVNVSVKSLAETLSMPEITLLAPWTTVSTLVCVYGSVSFTDVVTGVVAHIGMESGCSMFILSW